MWNRGKLPLRDIARYKFKVETFEDVFFPAERNVYSYPEPKGLRSVRSET